MYGSNRTLEESTIKTRLSIMKSQEGPMLLLIERLRMDTMGYVTLIVTYNNVYFRHISYIMIVE